MNALLISSPSSSAAIGHDLFGTKNDVDTMASWLGKCDRIQTLQSPTSKEAIQALQALSEQPEPRLLYFSGRGSLMFHDNRLSQCLCCSDFDFKSGAIDAKVIWDIYGLNKTLHLMTDAGFGRPNAPCCGGGKVDWSIKRMPLTQNFVGKEGWSKLRDMQHETLFRGVRGSWLKGGDFPIWPVEMNWKQSYIGCMTHALSRTEFKLRDDVPAHDVDRINAEIARLGLKQRVSASYR